MYNEDSLKETWSRREGPVVLATVSADGVPNIIYATCVSLYGDNMVVVADNYFDKTRRNIKNGSKGAILFMTTDHKAYQLKGFIEYHVDGPVFEEMKEWNPPQHPGHAAAALVVETVYNGANRIN